MKQKELEKISFYLLDQNDRDRQNDKGAVCYTRFLTVPWNLAQNLY